MTALHANEALYKRICDTSDQNSGPRWSLISRVYCISLLVSELVLHDHHCCQAATLPLIQGLDHVIFVTALERKIFLRQYAIKLKKSGTKVRRISPGSKRSSYPQQPQGVGAFPPPCCPVTTKAPLPPGEEGGTLTSPPKAS